MPTVTAPTIRFTVKEYFRMAEAGLFDDQRVELINGRIRKMAPQADPHVFAISMTNRTLSAMVPANEMLVVQGTLNLDRYNSVDPDFMWFDVPLGTPEAERPLSMLLIEVSNKSYRHDSGIKLRKYAKAGISDYWIENVRQNRVEVYREPVNPTGKPGDWRYASETHFFHGQSIPMLNRPAVAVAVDELLK